MTTKKKLPVAPAQKRDEEANRLGALSVETTIDLEEFSSSIREGLMAFCCNTGLVVVAEMMEAELTEKIGEKGRHDVHRTAFRNGSTAGSVILGGRRVPITKPRAIQRVGGELVLDAYRVFTNADLLAEALHGYSLLHK